MKKYNTYMLKCSDESYYVGVSNDVFLRVQQHNQGLDRRAYTYIRRPVKLVWYQEFLTPQEAIGREKQLKGWSRQKKEALIEGEYNKLPELSRNSLRRAQTDSQYIIALLPYTKPFLFVDEIIKIDANGVEGVYTFDKNSSFYQGHFKDSPVTPGVILTECCAQIGLVCLGIYLLGDAISKKNNIDLQIAMSSSEMEFYLPVLPGETVTVNSEKIYFRFNKLKCKVKLFNSDKKLVCKGILAGMLKLNLDGK